MKPTPTLGQLDWREIRIREADAWSVRLEIGEQTKESALGWSVGALEGIGRIESC